MIILSAIFFVGFLDCYFIIIICLVPVIIIFFLCVDYINLK